ncbi:SMI1/KNR4 family protein [Streptomyces sp. NBC_00513]|uniref:SMI1/KNR4 family protein n=1 Tax=unclassified Streptomyces TaxID=2593676 RepID=UPI0006AE8DF8|nr:MULTISPECIES: SMI1/KNR4 family protein [unclassified Streptomyces]MCX5072345.1 SMI1/KNR4 family protein [Streptomyces sp. NBC_00424]WUD44310.1 SMI1/KNR4 family protein [Streptomyces sp. NBC_00513]
MWREFVERYEGAELNAPASERELRDLEAALGQSLPRALRELLLVSDGVVDADGTDVVWSAEHIGLTNAEFRGSADFRMLYMPFDALVFFGDNGGGDQFAAVRTPERDDVFVWDHENDSRTWVAARLETYLRGALSRPGEDWYR